MTVSRLQVGDLSSYSKFSIAFEGHSRLDLDAIRQGHFVEIPVPSFAKDFDALESPAEWACRFDVQNWVRLETDGGSAIVAWNTQGVDMLDGRDDLAVLWDIRVDQAQRGRGIGKRLVEASQEWAQEHACTEFKVEAQDNNVSACRFYAAMGFHLTDIVPNAYEDLDEAMLIWRKRLA
jgi:ribosomal protein S18 acetylase RimI-like enzyme